MQLIWRKASSRIDRVVVGQHDMREMKIPIVLPVVDDHGKHLSHSVVHTLSSTIAVGVVSARGNFANAKELVEGIREVCLLYTSPSPRDLSTSRMPSSA